MRQLPGTLIDGDGRGSDGPLAIGKLSRGSSGRQEFWNAWEASLAILAESALYGSTDSGAGLRLVERRWILVDHPLKDVEHRVARTKKCRLSCQHLVHDSGQRELVAARVDFIGLAQCLLGRHVAGRAHQRRVCRQRCPIDLFELGNAEVQHLDELRKGTVSAQKDVPWLQISMHHTRAMRRGQRLADLRSQRQRLRQRQDSLTPKQRRQIFAVEKLHH